MCGTQFLFLDATLFVRLFVSLDVYPARSILHSRQLPSSLTNANTECAFVCVFYVTLCCVCLYVREWLDSPRVNASIFRITQRVLSFGERGLSMSQVQNKQRYAHVAAKKRIWRHNIVKLSLESFRFNISFLIRSSLFLNSVTIRL